MNKNFFFKQIQRMEGALNKLQQDLAKKEFTATAGGGMVTVKANGLREIVEVKIEKEVVNPEDVEMLEDLICAATNEALRKTQENLAEEISRITGFQIPMF
jgi:hypothetical protein